MAQTKWQRLTFSFLLSFSNYFALNAQLAKPESWAPTTYIGLSTQVYPAGIIVTANLESFFQQESSWLFRLGGNFTDRQDFSPYNDHEEGSGFGGSFGYRRHFPQKSGDFIVGLNTDIWNMWIQWYEDLGFAEASGTTYTLVLQPWIEAGYLFRFSQSPIQIGVSGGFGREINIITRGEKVGHDWIGSVLVYVQYGL